MVPINPCNLDQAATQVAATFKYHEQRSFNIKTSGPADNWDIIFEEWLRGTIEGNRFDREGEIVEQWDSIQKVPEELSMYIPCIKQIHSRCMQAKFVSSAQVLNSQFIKES